MRRRAIHYILTQGPIDGRPTPTDDHDRHTGILAALAPSEIKIIISVSPDRDEITADLYGTTETYSELEEASLDAIAAVLKARRPAP